MMATHAEKSGKNLEFWIQKSVQTLEREIELQMSLSNPCPFHISYVECGIPYKIWTVFKNSMNKLLNKKVFLSFSLPGVSYTSSNLKKVAIHVCSLNFCQCDFLLVMDCTVLHILES